MLHSGAGCSIIDLGSLERIGMQNFVERTNTVLINASGNTMNILGVVKIPMKISNGKIIIHEFKVLDMRSYTTILIGRDYMQLFDTVKFDFKQNIVHLGNTCEVYYFKKQRYRTNK